MTAPLGNTHNLRWSAAEDAALTKHLSADMSMSETAAALNSEFKTGHSRNAVIGRAHRLGLKSNVPKSMGTARHKAPRQAKPKPMPLVIKHTFVCEPSGARVADVVPKHVSLLDLDGTICHWPYGDSNFTFCGHSVCAAPYCEAHRALSLKSDMQGVNYNQTQAQRTAHRKARIPAAVSLAYVGEDFA